MNRAPTNYPEVWEYWWLQQRYALRLGTARGNVMRERYHLVTSPLYGCGDTVAKKTYWGWVWRVECHGRLIDVGTAPNRKKAMKAAWLATDAHAACTEACEAHPDFEVQS